MFYHKINNLTVMHDLVENFVVEEKRDERQKAFVHKKGVVGAQTQQKV